MRCRIDVHADARQRLQIMAEDVRRGLCRQPRSLPPKYFYDEAGSRLFEQITRLPEYYLTRAEEALIDALAPALMPSLAPLDVVELGAGFSLKTRRMLAARGSGALRYTPIDVDGATIAAAAARLLGEDPALEVHAIVGDFERDLAHVPAPSGRRLVLFLGSTIGNLDATARQALLAQLRALMRRADRLLLGVDLIKDPALLEAAYNDATGVTASFNRNILRVINHGLGADFRPEAFRHHAWYNAAESRIEMHLVCELPQTVHVRDLDLTLRLEAGESIWTESSYKFTEVSTREMLVAAGLQLHAWHTDADGRFGLALAAPGAAAHTARRAA